MNPNSNATERTYGTFVLGEHEFTLAAEEIREVVPLENNLIPLPLTPGYVLGLMSLRGEVIPVIHVGALLQVAEPGYSLSYRVAIVDCGTHVVGAVFESTGEVLEVDPKDLLPLEHSDADPSGVVTGVLRLGEGKRLVQILSAARIAHLDRIPRGQGGERAKEAFRPTMKVILARVNGVPVGMRVDEVLEIHQDLEIRPTPRYFEGCVGLVSIRDYSVPVLDLGAVFGRQGKISEGWRLLFVHDGSTVCAVLVDRVEDVADIYEENLQALPLLNQFECGRFTTRVLRNDKGDDLLFLEMKDLMAKLGANQSLPQSNARELLSVVSSEEKTEDLAPDTVHGSPSGFLVVKVGGDDYGFPLTSVREIRPRPSDPELLRPPGAGGSFMGLMRLRGEVLPVLDLASRYGMESVEGPHDQRVVVVELKAGRHGVLVDGLSGIFHDVPADAYDVPADMAWKGKAHRASLAQDVTSIVSIEDRSTQATLLVMSLDLEKLFSTAAA